MPKKKSMCDRMAIFVYRIIQIVGGFLALVIFILGISRLYEFMGLSHIYDQIPAAFLSVAIGGVVSIVAWAIWDSTR